MAQLYAKGAMVSAPSKVAPEKNSTRLTVPSVSLAVAASAIGAPSAKLAPLAGALSATLGGRLGALTLTVTALEVVRAPSSSMATAVRAWVPAGAVVQVYAKGAMVSAPSKLAPA